MTGAVEGVGTRDRRSVVPADRDRSCCIHNDHVCAGRARAQSALRRSTWCRRWPVLSGFPICSSTHGSSRVLLRRASELWRRCDAGRLGLCAVSGWGESIRSVPSASSTSAVMLFDPWACSANRTSGEGTGRRTRLACSAGPARTDSASDV